MSDLTALGDTVVALRPFVTCDDFELCQRFYEVAAPAEQPRGAPVLFLHDLTGVLWHIAQFRPPSGG